MLKEGAQGRMTRGSPVATRLVEAEGLMVVEMGGDSGFAFPGTSPLKFCCGQVWSCPAQACRVGKSTRLDLAKCVAASEVRRYIRLVEDPCQHLHHSMQLPEVCIPSQLISRGAPLY